jgi:HEAT repeat protein
VEKRELLTSLKNYIPAAGEKAPQWVVDLLGTALQDKSPVVVAEAAFQVGQFNAVELNTNLLTLYKESVKRFGASGYESRVQYSVIPALGKIGNNEAKILIADLLKNDNGSAMGDFLLEAIRNSNDPAFLNDLKLYKHKMANMVEAAKRKGDDPIFYSRKLAYIQVAAEVERSLLRKGGKNE